MTEKVEQIRDPIREIRITKGKNMGWHKMYISEKIFRTEHPNEKIYKPYWNAEKIGDWCMTDDGWVVQVLNITELINSTHKSGQKTKIFQFCCRNCRVYWNKDGIPKASKFFGDIVKLDQFKVSENYNPLGKYPTEKKKHMMFLIKSGFKPWQAYAHAYHVPYGKARILWYRLLIEDEWVIKEFNKMMNRSLPDDLCKNGLDPEYLMKRLKSILDNDKTSIENKKAIIGTLLGVLYDVDPANLQPAQIPGKSIIANKGAILPVDHPQELRETLRERAKGNGS